ncbi:MAG: hypothetical protein ACRCYU_06140, partial [Nocardioides sp.]
MPLTLAIRLRHRPSAGRWAATDSPTAAYLRQHAQVATLKSPVKMSGGAVDDAVGQVLQGVPHGAGGQRFQGAAGLVGPAPGVLA